MLLVDEEEIEKQNEKNKKTIKIIIISIVLLSILCMILIGFIIYEVLHPRYITTYIDGKKVEGFDTILDMQVDENGQTQIYIPIREFAKYLNIANPDVKYETYKGDYEPKTEEESKCHIVRDDYEAAIFSENSKIIYKRDLQKNNENYEEYYIDKEVFKSNDQLYASVQGIEKGYNIEFEYNETKKVIQIYTLDYIIASNQNALSSMPVGDYGTLEISSNNVSDQKSVFDNLLIIKNESGKYGIIDANDYSNFILEPQYDNIEFLYNSATFLVTSNDKIGVFSEDGKRKIDLIYDEIISMGKGSKLYLVKTNNLYGVVNENGNIIIYPEYDNIGINVDAFSYNGVKNGYILLDKLIPAKKDEKWGFFDLNGKMVTDGFKYEKIGCTNITKNTNVYELLQIPDYGVIVIGDEYDKYSFMDTSGNDTILPFVFDEIYIKMTTGEISYWMKNNDKEYNVLKNLSSLKK